MKIVFGTYRSALPSGANYLEFDAISGIVRILDSSGEELAAVSLGAFLDREVLLGHGTGQPKGLM